MKIVTKGRNFLNKVFKGFPKFSIKLRTKESSPLEQTEVKTQPNVHRASTPSSMAGTFFMNSRENVQYASSFHKDGAPQRTSFNRFDGFGNSASVHPPQSSAESVTKRTHMYPEVYKEKIVKTQEDKVSKTQKDKAREILGVGIKATPNEIKNAMLQKMYPALNLEQAYLQYIKSASHKLRELQEKYYAGRELSGKEKTFIKSYQPAKIENAYYMLCHPFDQGLDKINTVLEKAGINERITQNTSSSDIKNICYKVSEYEWNKDPKTDIIYNRILEVVKLKEAKSQQKENFAEATSASYKSINSNLSHTDNVTPYPTEPSKPNEASVPSVSASSITFDELHKINTFFQEKLMFCQPITHDTFSSDIEEMRDLVANTIWKANPEIHNIYDEILKVAKERDTFEQSKFSDGTKKRNIFAKQISFSV